MNATRDAFFAPESLEERQCEAMEEARLHFAAADLRRALEQGNPTAIELIAELSTVGQVRLRRPEPPPMPADGSPPF